MWKKLEGEREINGIRKKMSKKTENIKKLIKKGKFKCEK